MAKYAVSPGGRIFSTQKSLRSLRSLYRRAGHDPSIMPVFQYKELAEYFADDWTLNRVYWTLAVQDSDVSCEILRRALGYKPRPVREALAWLVHKKLVKQWTLNVPLDKGLPYSRKGLVGRKIVYGVR